MHSRRTAFQKRSLARLTLAAGSPVQVVAGSQTYENKKCSDPESPAMQRERDDEHACRDPRPANVDVPQEAHIPILGLQVPTWGTRPHRRQAVWACSPNSDDAHSCWNLPSKAVSATTRHPGSRLIAALVVRRQEGPRERPRSVVQECLLARRAKGSAPAAAEGVPACHQGCVLAANSPRAERASMRAQLLERPGERLDVRVGEVL